MNDQPLSLYLHIPFCGTRCTYCAFNVYTNLERLIPAYVAALCTELRTLGERTTLPLHTIYFGGGTPSLLSAEQIAVILRACRESFTVTPDAEITLEANPESVTLNYLRALHDLGINRLSIGMQSAQPGELALFARQHDVEAVGQAVSAARVAGYTNISLDLIYGVPTQTLDSWRATVAKALSFAPDHLSLYALQLETGTAFTKWVEHGKLPAPDDDLAADMYEAADDLLSAAGLAQYEISAWASSGHACRHNLQYWRGDPYLGVGAGAHGYTNGIRYEIVRAPQAYIERATAAQIPQSFPLTNTVALCEAIDQDRAMDEFMMTRLRLLETGVSRAEFLARFGIPLDSVYGDALKSLEPFAMLDISSDRIRLKKRARLISNSVLLHFIRT